MTVNSTPTNIADQPDQPWPIDPDDPNRVPTEQPPGTWPQDPDAPTAPEPQSASDEELGASREPA
jgi:hypothetical protein